MEKDIAFEMAAANIRFGPGVTREVGMDLVDRGVKRVMVLIDPALRQLLPVAAALESLETNKVEHEVFDRIIVEPTDASFRDAIQVAREGAFDGFVAIGGGSTIDSAKAANLYTTYPADFLDYVNAPVGKGLPIPGPLKTLIAIPTTAGTGSETTGVAIFDLVEMRAKTGIAHRNLKPTLGLIDPENTRTMPPAVAASTGLDVLSHALESFTAMPFDQRPMPERPLMRPSYQGSNPISDLWALEAMRMLSNYLPRAVSDPGDDEARAQMILASSFAGMGFGNAGVHLPHGMSYPVAGMVEDYRPPGYVVDHPMVPHGVSVIVNAPAVFRFTGSASPNRHLLAAEVLGADLGSESGLAPGEVLANQIISIMQLLGMPNGLGALGYTASHIPDLVKGTMPQHRVTKLSPRPAGEEELATLFQDAMSYW